MLCRKTSNREIVKLRESLASVAPDVGLLRIPDLMNKPTLFKMSRNRLERKGYNT